jgi:hypothetical protein
VLPHPVFKVCSDPDVKLTLSVADIDVPKFASFHGVFPNDDGSEFVPRLHRYGYGLGFPSFHSG